MPLKDLNRFGKRMLAGYALVLAYQLLLPPIVGLADNGDYAVVMDLFKLEPVNGNPEDLYFRYLVPKYRLESQRKPEVTLLTTAHLTLAPAWLLNHVVSKDGYFDLRWTGLTHGLMAAAALALVLPLLQNVPGWRRTALAAALLLVYSDPQYVAQMNSFYTDATAFAYLMLAVAFYLRRLYGAGDPRRNAWGLALSLGMFAAAKSQHALLAGPLVALLAGQHAPLAPLGRRGRIAALAALGLAGAVCLAFTPRAYTAQAFYNVVFLELLPRAADKPAVLRELGLKEEWIVYSGTGAYTPGTAIRDETFRQEFLARASHLRLAAYFLRHPGQAWALIKLGMIEAAYQRPYIGNFAKQEGLPPSHKSEAFYLWSRWKYLGFRDRPVLQFSYAVAVASLAVLLAWRKRPDLFPAVLTLAVMAAIELGLGVLADVAETTRHLFLYLALIDLLAVAAVCLMALPGTRGRAPAPAVA